MARISTPSNRSMQTFVLVDRTLLASTKPLKTAEKNIMAMPNVGSGLALRMPYGKSRPKVGRKATTVVNLNARCSLLEGASEGKWTILPRNDFLFDEGIGGEATKL